MNVLLSDLHISNSLPYSRPLADGTTDRLRDIASFFLRLIKLKPERVFILGDLFDKRRLDAVTLKVGTRIIMKLAECAEVYIVPGNHDTEDAAGNHNTLQYLTALDKHAGIRVLERGERFEIEGVTFHAFPYLTPRRFAETVEAQVVGGDRNVALFHQAIKGAMQSGVPFPSEVSPSIFKAFDLAIGGHVHHRQRIGNVAFVGSTYNLDFRETNEVQGYHTIDLATLDLEFVPSEMPRFRVYDGKFGEFDRDDYVVFKNVEGKPVGKARMLTVKSDEDKTPERARLDIDTDRFTWADAIKAYVEVKASESDDRPTLIELGKRLVGTAASRPGSVPGLVTFKSVEARDFLCFKKLDPVDLNKPGATLVIGRNRDTAAANSNGAGKSTIFRALTWALYGSLIEGGDVLRHGAKKASVALRFTKGGDEYVVERSRTRSRSSLKLRLGGDDITSEGSQKGTQEKIERLLGLDFLSFRNSVLFGQGDRMRFASSELKDEQRKRIFRSALDIDDVIKAAQRDASAAKSRQSAKVDEARRNVASGKALIDRIESEIDDLRERHKNVEEARAEKLKSTEEARGDLPDLDTLKRRLATLTKQRDDELDKATSIKESEKTIAKQDDRIADLDKRIRNEETEEAKTTARLLTKREELDRFKGGQCPTCGTTRRESSTFGAHYDKIKEDIEKLEQDQTDIREGIARLDTERQAAQEKRDEANVDLRDGLKHKRNADTMSGSIEGLRVKIEHLDRERERLDNEIKYLKRMDNPHEEQLASAKQERKAKRAEFESHKAEQRKAERAEGLLDFWVRGFGNKGIASFIVELYLPRLERHANRYLDILTDGDIKLALSATTLTSKGTETETLSVRYHIEGIDDALPSGGQLKKIEIAIDLAFMDILAERDGAEIGFIILDEILDGLDAEGRARVMVLIDVLRRRKGAAFVISHDAELRAAFDDVLLVVRKGGVSHVIDA